MAGGYYGSGSANGGGGGVRGATKAKSRRGKRGKKSLYDELRELDKKRSNGKISLEKYNKLSGAILSKMYADDDMPF